MFAAGAHETMTSDRSPALAPAQRGLVDTDTTPPGLRGGRCRDCDFRFFPFQTYGCERCGAHGDRLLPHTMDGRGTILSTAGLGPGDDPCVLARIAIDGGPEVRALVDGSAGYVPPGTRVCATLTGVSAAPGEEPEYELRFVPEPG